MNPWLCRVLRLAHVQITKASTVKKMLKDKKQRKLLRTADTN